MKKILFVIALLATGVALADCYKLCNQQLLDKSKTCAGTSYKPYKKCIAACNKKNTVEAVTKCRAHCDAEVNTAYTACSNRVKTHFDACINKCQDQQRRGASHEQKT